MWTVPRIWEGGTAVIIGGGPSILKQFNVPEHVVQGVYSGKLSLSAYSPYLEPIHKMHIIAVNVAYKIGPWIDVMFFGDDSTWREEKAELIKFKGLRITCATDLHKDMRLKFLKRNEKKRQGISTDPSLITWNGNSGSAAINLAVHFGVKRIILLGFDMQLNADKQEHWHKCYTTKLGTVDRLMQKFLQGFPAIKRDLDNLGIEVINANPDSKITCFTRINFKDIIL